MRPLSNFIEVKTRLKLRKLPLPKDEVRGPRGDHLRWRIEVGADDLGHYRSIYHAQTFYAVDP